ncbi:MAG: hypothetical protein Kow0029_07880 [Candidatus Rifleibacteriota bacterium]
MRKILCLMVLAAFCLSAAGSVWAQEGFVPKWNVGDRWTLEASYRDMRSPGEVWMPPLQWIFKVRAKKVIQDQECYVVHVYPKNRSLKVQAVLWLAVDDLRPVRVIDIFPTSEGVKSSERDIDPGNPQPLLAEDTLVPYDLPVFPLVKVPSSVQNADGFSAYRSEGIEKKFAKVSKIGGLSFKRIIGQKNKTPDKQYADTFAAYRTGGESFQVELAEPRSNTSLIQLWQEGAPWAITSESVARKIRLLPPTPPTPLPETGNGGDE